MTSQAMEFNNVFNGRTVLLTGHTGFKGSWLTEWLLSLGAKVVGVGLEPLSNDSLFGILGIGGQMDHRLIDIRDRTSLASVVREVEPDFVFHLAAQALVRSSYELPVETYEVNVMGTIHLLEALRAVTNPCAAVFVTSDKCYENREWIYGYREEDPMGGYDPYSSSKGIAELAINSYRRSFYSEHPVKVASARAGNVIGGGDWAKDRIVPDCIRSLTKGEAIPVRNKVATRPWQHVLEPLSGYLLLAARIYEQALDSTNRPPVSGLLSPQSGPSTLDPLCSAFNFGPALESNRTVDDLVTELLKHWPGTWEDQSDPNAPHEAGKLNLATDKAAHLLNWFPVWNFEQTVKQTISWYRAARTVDVKTRAAEKTSQQISQYVADARSRGLSWAA